MSYKFGNRSNKEIFTCNVTLQKVARKAISDLRCPYDFGIIFGHRTTERQFELFKKGRVFEGNVWRFKYPDRRGVVTYCDGVIKKSDHNNDPSDAFDFGVFVDGIYINGDSEDEKKKYMEVGLHILEVANEMFENGEIDKKVNWGGLWLGKFKDYPHIYS